MNALQSFRHTVQKYYPRHHLVTASVLGLILVVTVAFTPSEKTEANRLGPEAPRIVDASAIGPTAPETDTGPSAASSQSHTQTIITNGSVERGPAEIINTAAVVGPQRPGTQPRHDQTAIATAVASAESSEVSPWTEIEVQRGDNLSDLFVKVGLSAQDLYRVLNSNDEARVLNRLYPGYQLNFNMPEPGKLAQLKVLKSPLDGYLFTLIDGNYQVESLKRSPEIRTAFKTGQLADSLFMAGQRAEIPAAKIMEMANIFGGVIDFILDPRNGDNFSILYEEKYLDGEYVGTGEILAAQFTNRGKRHIALRYEDTNGETDYYSPEGVSMRKAFLRTPLDVFRISSNFNLRRKHPILNTIRAHKGTDYAAPRGTPVRATSDGRVTWAARNGSFGKLIVIQHNSQFETKYAHLNDYASGIKQGARVKQGQIIGYVGTTGGSTGPHLHYEFLVNGVHKNPRTILDQLPKAQSIEVAEKQRFTDQTRGLLEQFTSYHDSRLLSLNEGADSSSVH